VSHRGPKHELRGKVLSVSGKGTLGTGNITVTLEIDEKDWNNFSTGKVRVSEEQFTEKEIRELRDLKGQDVKLGIYPSEMNE